MKTGEPAPPVVRIVGILALVGALVLLVLGGVPENFRALPSGRIPADTPVPVILAPAGEQEQLPTVFRWTPGGPDVDFSQVLVFDDSLSRIWTSAPVRGSELTVDPAIVFDGIQAGTPCAWSVREVYQGRPRATSALQEFSFNHDWLGRPIGESRPGPKLLR
jgi:hypothetical protein